ncbi:c6 zinc finger domain protein [Fusarium flagelliforme]|uniref:C6 zinc finger domain protein n=1 Tax=Fusarium flagelliforme TaxID=2675880 RepID=A0A395MZX9_9HYPO|nr:c6 zinc finger domain protein [Fusarium flagelliforme]
MQSLSQQNPSSDVPTLEIPGEDETGQYQAGPWLNSPDQWGSLTVINPLDTDATASALLIPEEQPTPSPVPSWDCTDLNGMAWADVGGSLPSPFSVIQQLTGPQILQTELVSSRGEVQPLSPMSEALCQAVDTRQSQREDQVEEIPRQILHIPTALSEYFFTEVIPLYCVWDSKSNIMRSIVENMWQSSGALHHTIQSMAAACLSETFPHLLTIARQEHSLALEYVKNREEFPAQKQALTLAMTFLGHTSSWISPNNLAPDMYRTSCKMLEDMNEGDGNPATSFFAGTMDYWGMLLAYLTDSEESDVPDTTSASQTNLIEPHPYCGISNQIIKVLRSIGLLIFRYRKQMSNIGFMTERHVDIFRDALRHARRLERVLLAHRLPDLSQIQDPGDPQTSLIHMKLMDDAYRHTGLLQLYRVFPDLLIERYAPWDKTNILQPVPETKIPSAEERQVWLTELALHVIKILEEIPFESRTRSAQPFIMVAVSSELVIKSEETSGNGGFACLDQLPLRVSKARKFLASRLAAYTHILPLQKTRAISQLINHIWSALDAGEQHVYWLDMAYQKKLGTMFG